MDQCTHEIRTEYWKGVIQACGQRPAGQSAKSWMEENGICERSYYHWQRKFRQQSYELVKDSRTDVATAQEKTDVAFVEIPCAPLSPQKDTTKIMDNSPVAVIRTPSMGVEITNDISDCVLARIIREVSHA